MLLRALLTVCVLCRVCHGDPDTASSGPAVDRRVLLPTWTLSKETVLARSLAELTGAIRQVQSGLLALDERLDVMQASQVDIQRTQRSFATRLDSLQGTIEDVSDRLSLVNREPDHLHATSEALGVVTARLDILVETRGALSSRLDRLLDTQKTELSSLLATQAVHSAHLSEARRSLDGISDGLEVLLRQDCSGHGGAPRRALGSRCYSDDECFEVRDAVCGQQRRCVCRNGFRQVSAKLCRKIPKLGEPCWENADCLILTGNSTCSSTGQCTCSPGFYGHNNECWSSVSRGSPCNSRRQCGVGLDCVDRLCSCPVSKHGIYEYRLAGGPDCQGGRVELRSDGEHHWRFVCDDDWDENDAAVVCHSLGFARNGAEAVGGSRYGGSDNFAMDDVACDGDESHLAYCDKETSENCEDDEVAGVICKN